MIIRPFGLYLVCIQISMKKVLYIGVAILGLTVVSCQKQEIKPISSTENTPEWKSVSEENKDSEKNGLNDPTLITDPNNDPDGNGK